MSADSSSMSDGPVFCGELLFSSHRELSLFQSFSGGDAIDPKIAADGFSIIQLARMEINICENVLHISYSLYMETPRRQSLTRVPSSTGNAKPSLHFPLHPTPRPDLDTPPPGYYLILLIVIALSFRH
uniref:Uncharacterized protein n=1 Tax=Coccidioides posadasii RMSCC 3488 TaxID=454284 RepID=A0A0J6FIU5_COCPO|nr:hypothetical protein CPAG_06535 [Coccidioides posadasii RMSCC 3488]